MSKSQNLASVRKTLANTPEILRQILAGVSREQMDWKASAERWTISEILTHLIVVDEQVAGLRAKRIFLEDNPLLASYDQIEAYQAGVFSGNDGFEMLEKFAEVRRKSFEFLDKIEVSALDRIGQHAEIGEVKLVQFLNIWAFHDLGHMRQIAEIIRAVNFWDGIGNLQKFYSVNP
jgi:hypothetical protein